MPFRTFQSIEAGLNWPELHNLEAIASALNVEVTDLFREPFSRRRITPKEALEVINAAFRKLSSQPMISISSDHADADETVAEVNNLLKSSHPVAINNVSDEVQELIGLIDGDREAVKFAIRMLKGFKGGSANKSQRSHSKKSG